MNSPYVLVIDTEQPSVSFDRQMCAYITGHVGDCGVGVAEASIYKEEVSGVTLPIVVHLEVNGCKLPCSVWETPDWSVINKQPMWTPAKSDYTNIAYFSVGIFFSANPTEYLDFLLERCLVYAALSGITIYQVRILQRTPGGEVREIFKKTIKKEVSTT